MKNESKVLARQKKREAIAKLYNDGLCLREIGEIYGVSRERIRQIMEDAGCKRRDKTITARVRGLERRRKPVPVLDKDVLSNLFHKEKLNLAKIAKHFKVSLDCVNHNLRQYGFSRDKLTTTKNLDLTNEKLKHFYIDLNKTLQEVADMFGYSKAAIAQKLRKANIRKINLLPLIDKESLKHLYFDLGHSAAEIGDMLGCSPYIVYSYCEKFSLRKGKGGHTRSKFKREGFIDKKSLEHLYLELGYTAQKIAEELGVERSIVCNLCARYNLKKRSRNVSKKKKSPLPEESTE